MTKAAAAQASSQHFNPASSKELDVYAAEFAKLVAQCTPHRDGVPDDWLRQLPDEAFDYYREGIATFGEEAASPVERRGRLYLIHTCLLFMWISWGREKARTRFRNHLSKGTRRAASLVKLEYLRRAGVLSDYDVPNWFYQPVDEWTAALVTEDVQLKTIPDGEMKRKLQEQDVVQCRMTTLSTLQGAGIIPPLPALSLK